jgi:hypothetical protein
MRAGINTITRKETLMWQRIYHRVWYAIMAAPFLALADVATASAAGNGGLTEIPNIIEKGNQPGVPTGVVNHLEGAAHQIVTVAGVAGGAAMTYGAAKWAYGHSTHNPQHGQTGRQALFAGLCCGGIAIAAPHLIHWAGSVANWVG